MKQITMAVFILVLFVTMNIEAQIDIVSPCSIQCYAPNFTGNVRMYGIIPSGHPSNISGEIVTFEPGARTVWHSHPKGQRIIIIQGVGWVQQWGKNEK